MSGFSREHADDDMQEDAANVNDNEVGTEALDADEDGNDDYSQSYSASAGRSIMAAFAWRSNDDRSQRSGSDESIMAMTVSSGSVFVPSISEG